MLQPRARMQLVGSDAAMCRAFSAVTAMRPRMQSSAPSVSVPVCRMQNCVPPSFFQHHRFDDDAAFGCSADAGRKGDRCYQNEGHGSPPQDCQHPNRIVRPRSRAIISKCDDGKNTLYLSGIAGNGALLLGFSYQLDDLLVTCFRGSAKP